MDMVGITEGGAENGYEQLHVPCMKFSKTKQKTLLKQDISGEKTDPEGG